MEKELVLIVGAAVFVVMTLFGVAAHSYHLTHKERMECMKLGGEYVKPQCVFRAQK